MSKFGGKISGPTPKGIWNRHYELRPLAPQARSNYRSTLRMKGKSKYPGGTCLVDPPKESGE